MKITIMIFALISILNADIIITQNMKALYKGVELTEIQEDYILDNQDRNIDVFKEALKQEVKKLHRKSLEEKNVVSFV